MPGTSRCRSIIDIIMVAMAMRVHAAVLCQTTPLAARQPVSRMFVSGRPKGTLASKNTSNGLYKK
eukprot:633223-Pyramimonas_sp.AAC.1